jgi:O2-independent ubiquinone biosynthesis accessory factor UbiT
MKPGSSRRFREAPLYLLGPIPVVWYQPFLQYIVHNLAAMHPRLFDRLGSHSTKSFLIRPTNLPFVLLLRPHPENPQMTAFSSDEGLDYQASIAGSFLNLLRLLDGRGDGDAIFFSRDLKIEGDTEAVVCLRNAIDDVEGSIAEDIAGLFGPFGNAGLSVLRHIDA